MELKNSDQERNNSRLQQSQAYTKTLERDLQEARDEICKLTNKLNNGADDNIKTVGKVNKQDIQIVELRDMYNTVKQQ